MKNEAGGKLRERTWRQQARFGAAVIGVIAVVTLYSPRVDMASFALGLTMALTLVGTGFAALMPWGFALYRGMSGDIERGWVLFESYVRWGDSDKSTDGLMAYLRSLDKVVYGWARASTDRSNPLGLRNRYLDQGFYRGCSQDHPIDQCNHENGRCLFVSNRKGLLEPCR